MDELAPSLVGLGMLGILVGVVIGLAGLHFISDFKDFIGKGQANFHDSNALI